MSNYQYDSMQPVQKARPTSATVFAILNLVFAGLASCGLAFSLFGLIAPQAASFGQPNPTMDAITGNPAALTVAWVSNIWSLVTIVLMITAGIGLLAVKPYGRLCSIAYAISSLLEKVFGLIGYYAVTGPLMRQAVQDMADDPNFKKEQVEVMEMAMDVTQFTTVIIVAITAIYPVLVLIYMNRKPILKAYKPGYQSEDHYGDQPRTLPADYQPPDQNNPYSSPFDPKD